VGDKLTQEYILITSSNFPAGGAGANYLIDDFLISLNLIFQFFTFLSNRKQIKILLYNNELHSNIIIYAMAKIFGIKVISFVPEFYDKNVFKGSLLRMMKWYGFLINFSFLNVKSYKLIVFSHYLKNQYLARGYKETDIIVQPNLTDFDFWKADGSIIKYQLGYSGTPTKGNGLFDLFEAISLLQKEGINSSLVVVGDNPYGDSFVPELVTHCKNLGINDSVSFKGLVELDDVKVLLSECEILTLTRPSIIQTEAGFPTKLGEYFAAKKIILVTNFGDIEKYFVEGTDLVIAQSGNVEDIARKIKWIIQNELKAKTITENGFNKAKALLEYKTSVNRIVGLIN
jgi:glycosyltransferase involved in cell wall biosynthesis